MASLQSAESAQFDIQKVLEVLRVCREDNEILLCYYVGIFQELSRFFGLLGKIFVFVVYDLQSKVDVLKAHIESHLGSAPSPYHTVSSMISYERKNNFCTDNKQPNGCRTLLRLHRSFEFIIVFLKRLLSAADDAKSATIAQEEYEKTLGRFHPWVVRKMSFFAMYTLPSRGELVHLIAAGRSQDELTRIGPEVIQLSQLVYDETQRLYSENYILDLP